VMAELKNYFGDKLCKATVPRNIRLAEAPSHGKPALLYDPRSKGAESYIRLAKEIIERAPGFGLLASDSEAPSVEEHKDDASVEEIPAAGEMDKTA
jgi:hypothetical protein